MVQDESTGQRADEGKLALSNLAGILYANFWPCTHSFLHKQTNVLRTLFHLARQVGGCGKDEIGVGLACFHMQIETLDVDLCRCSSLLTESHTFPEFGELSLEVDREVAWVW